MKKTLAIISMLLMSAAFGAQGNGKGRGNDPYTTKPMPQSVPHPMTNPNSNAPGSVDRDKGTGRAEDVGKGKKKGLRKTHHGRTKTAARS